VVRQMTSENAAAAAGGGEPPAGTPEAARRPLRKLMDDRLDDPARAAAVAPAPAAEGAGPRGLRRRDG
jgi:hypothetical protein